MLKHYFGFEKSLSVALIGFLERVEMAEKDCEVSLFLVEFVSQASSSPLLV
jgi:hypothetical protein